MISTMTYRTTSDTQDQATGIDPMRVSSQDLPSAKPTPDDTMGLSAQSGVQAAIGGVLATPLEHNHRNVR